MKSTMNVPVINGSCLCDEATGVEFTLSVARVDTECGVLGE